jgi:hypothetical protein
MALQDIYTTALECKKLFAKVMDEKTAYAEQAFDHQRRFMSWASYLGVFASMSASLDNRLRDAPEVKEMVILLLNVLKRNLARGTQSLHASAFLTVSDYCIKLCRNLLQSLNWEGLYMGS